MPSHLADFISDCLISHGFRHEHIKLPPFRLRSGYPVLRSRDKPDLLSLGGQSPQVLCGPRMMRATQQRRADSQLSQPERPHAASQQRDPNRGQAQHVERDYSPVDAHARLRLVVVADFVVGIVVARHDTALPVWIAAACADDAEHVQNQAGNHEREVSDSDHDKPEQATDNLPFVNLSHAWDQKTKHGRSSRMPSGRRAIHRLARKKNVHVGCVYTDAIQATLQVAYCDVFPSYWKNVQVWLDAYRNSWKIARRPRSWSYVINACVNRTTAVLISFHRPSVGVESITIRCQRITLTFVTGCIK